MKTNTLPLGHSQSGRTRLGILIFSLGLLLGLALGLALVVRIHEAYGTIEDDEVHDQEVD